MKKITTRTLVFSALLTALAVILKIFGIPVTLFGGFIKDINLSPSVIMYSGMMFGPVIGGIVGALTDILVFLIRPMGGYFPIFTITNALIGIIPGLFFLKKHPAKYPMILLATAVTMTVCSFIINTLALIGLGFLPAQIAWFRAASTFLFIPIHAVIIYLLVKATSRLFVQPVSPGLAPKPPVV